MTSGYGATRVKGQQRLSFHDVVYCEFSNFVIFKPHICSFWNLSLLGCVKMRNPQIHGFPIQMIHFEWVLGAKFWHTIYVSFSSLFHVYPKSHFCLRTQKLKNSHWNRKIEYHSRLAITLHSFQGANNHCERRICWTFWTGNPWLSRKPVTGGSKKLSENYWIIMKVFMNYSSIHKS